MSSLFTVPISSGGEIQVSTPKESYYLLTFNSPADNRIRPPFLTAFLLALDILERNYPKGVLITTSAIPKFYSNGFILDDLIENDRFFPDYFLPLHRRLLTYPFPTISLINSHCFGAGVFLSIAHDYTLMNPSRGWWCLPEVDLGVAIPPTIVVLLKAKIPKINEYRNAALTGKRFVGKEAVDAGFVDAVGSTVEDAIKFSEERKLVEKSKKGAIGGLKEDTWREVLTAFEEHDKQVAWRNKIEQDNEIRNAEADKKVKEWQSNGGKLSKI